MSVMRGWCGVAFLAAVVALGCGDRGPKSYRVQGTVKLDGQPIPFGEVIFTPDAAEKNAGPQGIAEIHDGKFDTRAGRGKGVAGGPTIIRVNGMSGPGGKTLCEYEMKANLPKEDTTRDIEVPKQGPGKQEKDI